MIVLGIDLGTSSVKVSVVNVETGRCIASAQYPDLEAPIISTQPGWAEQSPDRWWEDVKQAILKCHAQGGYNPLDIDAIGIAYQMHGLVLVDRDQHVLRNSIIWCDSRAVEIGEKAFSDLDPEYCLQHLLNSPGNFTASKLAWVQREEPAIYNRIDKVMLPGDFIAMKLTGEITTTPEALSEGIWWDFQSGTIADALCSYFEFDRGLFPDIKPVFGTHGTIKSAVAARLSLRAGIPVSYKAGDQPNNALALQAMEPGDVVATAGTSGVIYGVTDRLAFDPESRINSFAHVNHSYSDPRIGVLLCINGAGIFNRWMKAFAGSNTTYAALNLAAAAAPAGAGGLFALPFGNGAERMLGNRQVGAHFHNLDFNTHALPHMARAVQEGIAFAFRYGLDIMRENGIYPSVIRAAQTNLFLSEVFAQSFADVNNVAIEFFDGDGSYGAAIGAAMGTGITKSDVIGVRTPTKHITPVSSGLYATLYEEWKEKLELQLQQSITNALPVNIS